jgi:hypothetical protein
LLRSGGFIGLLDRTRYFLDRDFEFFDPTRDLFDRVFGLLDLTRDLLERVFEPFDPSFEPFGVNDRTIDAPDGLFERVFETFDASTALLIAANQLLGSRADFLRAIVGLLA